MKFLKKGRQAADRISAEDPTRNLSLVATTGLIFLMLIYLALTIYSSNKLAENTKYISSHPFEVVISAGDIKNCVSQMQIRAERLTKYNSEADIELVQTALSSLWQSVEKPLSVVEAQYLGASSDVENVKSSLIHLKHELDACILYAGHADLPDIEDYEELHLYPLYETLTAQLDFIIQGAQARKLLYGEMAEVLRKRTLSGSLFLMILMVCWLIISQHVQRRQRQELYNRGLLFDNLSRSIDDSFLISNTNTGELYYQSLNFSRIFGHGADRLEDVFDGFLPEDKELIQKTMLDPDYSFPFVKEVPYSRPAGEQRWFSVRIYRADGMKKPQIITVFSDITSEIVARRSLQDAMANAEQANAAKSVFLSRMSHEIRTPLNAVIGMTTIAAASVNDSAKVQDCLEKINFSSKHLLMLINDVLDMSKIESNKMTLQSEPFDLFEVINSFSATVYAQARNKGVEFSEIMEGFGGQAQYLGDSLRLNQILLNLSSNAVKFTSPGGKIHLEVCRIASRTSADIVRFTLSDTGIGMTKEALDRIFKPFEQADASIAGRFGGTGLGMSITKTLTSLMNGKIEVKSDPGVGTTCIVELPFQRAGSDEKMPDFDNLGISALVVDDEQAVCEETSALLERIKIQAEWITNGESAVLRVMEAHRANQDFDFCLIDWKMPGMDGIEVTRRIRACVGDALPIVMISAYDCSEIEEEAKNAGVNAFLPKPLYRSSVYAAIKEALSPGQETLPEAAPADRAILKGRHMLIAEDNELNRDILSELLSMDGITSDCASDGSQALELFLQKPSGYYDAILMDVQMPVLNGHDATKMLRASNHPDSKDIPIIATTANAYSDDVAAALSAGMNAHIGKPIDLEQLNRILIELIRK